MSNCGIRVEGEATPAPSAVGDGSFGFSQVVEVKVPVLAWLICPDLVPELLHSMVWDRFGKGPCEHVCEGLHISSFSSFLAGVQVPVPDSPGLHKGQCHELGAL